MAKMQDLGEIRLFVIKGVLNAFASKLGFPIVPRRPFNLSVGGARDIYAS